VKASTLGAVLWTATALAAAAGISQFVLFWMHREERLRIVDVGSIRQGVRETARPKGALERPDRAFYDVITNVNVRGVAPPKPVEDVPVTSAPVAKINPLETVVRVRATQVHVANAGMSNALVSWLDTQISDSDRKNHILIKEGQAFPKPYDTSYRVKKIETDLVRFEDKAGAEVTLTVQESPSPSAITRREGGPAGRAASGPSDRPANYSTPAETKQNTPNEFWLSEADRELLETQGTEMLGREIQTAPYIDPKTRRPEALRVTVVRPGSTASKLGLREGDLVKAVNGAKVRSTSDVYAFAHDNPDVKSVQVTIERFGRPITLTYVLP
jgi:type II secretory pathway component PulC